ncbi:MAG: M20 family metallopeptidase [Thermoprotei archaeon]
MVPEGSPEADVEQDFESYCTKALEELIAIPTVNPPGDKYYDCARYIEGELSDAGLETKILSVPEKFLDSYYPYSPAHRGRARPIVYAWLGEGEPSIHFNGHYDVVPPGAGWSRDPFAPVVTDGKMFGRGSTDMKAGLACMLGCARWAAENRSKLKGKAEFSFVPDEESGGVGSRFLVTQIKPAARTLIAEPTYPHLQIGHKGIVRGLVKVGGKQVHGSTPWLGVNAFVKAAETAVVFLNEYQRILESRRTMFDTLWPEGVHPTVNLGGFAESASKKDNVVPGEFSFSVDRRTLPEEDLDQVVAEVESGLQKSAKQVGSKLEFSVTSAVRGSYTPATSSYVQECLEAVRKTGTESPRLLLSTGRDDGVFFREMGSAAVTYGPGVEAVAHSADEYVPLSQLGRVLEAYTGILRDFCMI